MNNHIRELRQARGLSLNRLEEITGISAQQLNRLEKGERRLNQDNVQVIARALGAQINDLIGTKEMVPIKGEVGAGGEICSVEAYENGGALEYAPNPPGFDPAEIVALRIKGDSMHPAFQEGWIVYYSDRRDIEAPVPCDIPSGKQNISFADRLEGFYKKPCVVKLVDGRVLLKVLKRGNAPGRFTLSSYNASDIENVEIEWAAKVIFVKTD